MCALHLSGTTPSPLALIAQRAAAAVSRRGRRSGCTARTRRCRLWSPVERRNQVAVSCSGRREFVVAVLQVLATIKELLFEFCDSFAQRADFVSSGESGVWKTCSPSTSDSLSESLVTWWRSRRCGHASWRGRPAAIDGWCGCHSKRGLRVDPQPRRSESVGRCGGTGTSGRLRRFWPPPRP